MQHWGVTEEVTDMEEVMCGHVMTDPVEEEEEEEEEEEDNEEEEVGSRVVARCSFSGSRSMESRRTWAVLRGWRSFCTAAVRKTMSFSFKRKFLTVIDEQRHQTMSTFKKLDLETYFFNEMTENNKLSPKSFAIKAELID